MHKCIQNSDYNYHKRGFYSYPGIILTSEVRKDLYKALPESGESKEPKTTHFFITHSETTCKDYFSSDVPHKVDRKLSQGVKYGSKRFQKGTYSRPLYCLKKWHTAFLWQHPAYIHGITVLWNYMGLPRWHSGKESTCQCRRYGFYPWMGRSLEEEMAIHSSILAWRIPRTEEPGGLQSRGSQKSWIWLKRPWCWERLKVGGEGDDRGRDGWMASPTQWTCVWVSSGSWWWTGKPGVLQLWGHKELDRTEWLNWLSTHTLCFPFPWGLRGLIITALICKMLKGWSMPRSHTFHSPPPFSSKAHGEIVFYKHGDCASHAHTYTCTHHTLTGLVELILYKLYLSTTTHPAVNWTAFPECVCWSPNRPCKWCVEMGLWEVIRFRWRYEGAALRCH